MRGNTIDDGVVGWAYYHGGKWHLCKDEPAAHNVREQVVLRSIAEGCVRRAKKARPHSL